MSKMVKYTNEEIQYKFTCLVADSIRHVKKYFFNRKNIDIAPTTAQQIGEFTTQFRRLLQQEYDIIGIEFYKLTNPKSWNDVGVPNKSRSWDWKFSYQTTCGACWMTKNVAVTLCENAVKMAIIDKSTDEEFMEVDNSLNDLINERSTLDFLICKAKDLNVQATIVVDSLCVIAEQLQEFPNDR